MNAVRRRFSKIKGGKLARAAYPAKVVSLVVSDIPGDNLADVASGPTIPVAQSRSEVLSALEHYRIDLPSHIRDHIQGAGLDEDRVGDVGASHEAHLTASARLSLEAAAREAERQGIPAVILSDSIEGEARDSGQFHGALAVETALRNRPFKKPVVILSGGETTVTVRQKGRGGRNTEFQLALAPRISGFDIHALAADTDGIDGTEENAGAFVDGSSDQRLRQAGFEPQALLARNDSWSGFDAIGDLFSPGPTGTNVNDFRAILVL